ncbi:saccharopine dehydrogenase family protein [Pigmentiphaga aceris]|uniref:Saccharopine dehydrogenase family protein n=1 Tax=Pigmentiphaga aceris TaxID=1940612 RepID=A0A5C0AYT9_9BURK|nr:saccharopine dehydrogenase C-terminal domain-containing protein [Pigmentiphaga aceris]QEI07622.1 saccharopine dehydrogenase family protein [Pigmentiphaga aceris]
MSTSIRHITVLGAGKIGFALALLLQRSGSYVVRVADRDANRLALVAALGCDTLVLDQDRDTAAAIDGQYAVLNALPFRYAHAMAQQCAQRGVHYFDLTEDVENTQAIRRLGVDARTVLMPQCGLAPGFIGIVGNDLAKRFDRVLDVKMRVGALPRYPSNALRYNLTWSTDGLINEYCNPCEAIVEGEKAQVQALEGLETFVLDGVEYEAFNTSGGLGTLPDTLLGRARNVDYKSIRYPGHRQILKLLLDDLRLRDRRDLLKDIFENALPATAQDVIVILASATGYQGASLIESSYIARILGQTVDGHALSAIQLSTACGMCAALDLVAEGHLPQAGFIGQEAIGLDAFMANRFGQVYAGKPVANVDAQAELLALA